MRLVICGNGLDMHLGFKTNYQAYRKYLSDSVFMDGKSAIAVIEESPFFIDRDSDCWTDLESSLTFDCEKYIKAMVYAFDRDMTRYDPEASRQQIAAANAFHKVDPEKIAFEFTNKWFFEWIAQEYYSNFKQIAAGYSGIISTALCQDDVYLTFNYTPTLEDIFGIPREQILYIHNRFPNKPTLPFTTQDLLNDVLESGRKKFQFGSTHNCLEEWDSLLKNIKIQNGGRLLNKEHLEQNVHQIYFSFTKSLSNNYDALKTFIEKQKIDEVMILGHSFLGIDRPYYDDIIIPLLRDCHWNIFCHQSCNMAKEFIKKYNIADFELNMW